MFTGIISAIGRITDVQPASQAEGTAAHGKRLTIHCPTDYLQDVALSDSIALNGACMTVNRVSDLPSGCEVSINLIPHTLENNPLHTLQVGECQPGN